MATEVHKRNPYVGPRPFEHQERALFFGREREASSIVSLVIAHRALLLYAPSGAGKTSLLNAGLIPLLEEERFEVLPVARVRGLIPTDIKPKEIPNLYVFNTLMNWAEDEADPRHLAQMSLADFLKEREHPTDEMELPAPRVVIFDQLEELFAFYPERWRDREKFFKQIHDALESDPLLRVVFVIREDYIAQLDPYALLMPEKLRIRFRLDRLRKEAALAAITGPLKDTKRSFAEGVTEQLVEELLKIRVTTAAGEIMEVIGEFIEPVQLQVVCQSLWWDLPPDVTVITPDHLQAFSDVNQALSGFYERSIKRAAEEVGVREGDLRAWFEYTLITPAGTRGTVYIGQKTTGGIPNAAVDVLESLHLIRGEWRAGARWYELTHDRFIEPIRESNKVWRERTREQAKRILLGALGIVVVTLVVILAVGVLFRPEALRQPDKGLDFTKIFPETERLQNVQLLDADGDGKNEWIVFYKFDLVEGTTERKFSVIGAAAYNDDHGAPPVIFPYELHPPDRFYLGEQNCVAEVRDLIFTNEGPEMLVSCFAEEGLVVDLSVFHWYDHDKDDLSKKPNEERQGYECLGSFHGSGGITLDGSRVIVKERTEERSQLSRKNVYVVREGSYFQPGGRELSLPVETGIDFAFGVPEDVAQSPYPEKIVLAFYLALGQNNPLAQTYLSEVSGLKDVVGSFSFGTAASGDQIQKVLVKRIIYTPDREKEEKHEPVRVTITVSSVTNVGEDPSSDVTWEVIWESAPEGAAKPGWKLHRMITR